MRYCPKCLEEYQDDVKGCADCGGEGLLSEEEISSRPEFRRVREDEDTTDFVSVGTAEDPFEADAFTAAIGEAGIPVLAALRRSSAVDALTMGVQQPWWEILAPAESQAKAEEIVEARRKELATLEAEAARAAEEEELEGEKATGT